MRRPLRVGPRNETGPRTCTAATAALGSAATAHGFIGAGGRFHTSRSNNAARPFTSVTIAIATAAARRAAQTGNTTGPKKQSISTAHSITVAAPASGSRTPTTHNSADCSCGSFSTGFIIAGSNADTHSKVGIACGMAASGPIAATTYPETGNQPAAVNRVESAPCARATKTPGAGTHPFGKAVAGIYDLSCSLAPPTSQPASDPAR